MKVLIVDDEISQRTGLAAMVSAWGMSAETAAEGNEALEKLQSFTPDVILTDLNMPGMDGFAFLEKLREQPEMPPTIVLTAFGNIETAVRTVHELGAYWFLEKPIQPKTLEVLVRRAGSHSELHMQKRTLERQLVYKGSLGELVGRSPVMQEIFALLQQAGPSKACVLITGESGTGKELVAHAIHALSPRASEAFVEVNCAAIPEELIESELFGHSKGSFTSAHETKIGKFQKADGGTLFLDEVGDMSLRTQAKVLRALEEQRFEPVGAAASIQVDVRVVAATNKNLEEEIERGNFREDLFYRLNVIPFHVPPLRDRKEDIPLLADHFLGEFTRAYGRKPKELTAAAYAALQEHHWPGNVRELRNLIERIVILNPQVRIDARHIPLNVVRRTVVVRSMDRFGSLQEVREAAEREYILQKLEETSGNVTRTAELLGLERSNLYRKMRTLGIAPKE